jgi:epoxyqueuosine reductase
MTLAITLTNEIIDQAESYDGIKAGVVPLKDVMEGLSYKAMSEGQRSTNKFERGSIGNWPMMTQTVLVLGLEHPEDKPQLDYWERSDTPGNRRLREISWSLEQWLKERYSLSAIPLAYLLEKGGLFLKDAAVLSGIGVIGRNNLLLHPEWGPRIRLRAMLMEGDFHGTEPLAGFDPCKTCEVFCQKACPMNAFPDGKFSGIKCSEQMDADEKIKVLEGDIGESGGRNLMVNYCRRCELSCPVGA